MWLGQNNSDIRKTEQLSYKLWKYTETNEE